MSDGHLGKCKACARKDVADRVAAKSATDLDWVLSERERHRLKSQRQRAEGRATVGDRLQATRKYRKRNPLKWAAHCILNNAIRVGKIVAKPCEACGDKAEAHHDDYSKPLKVRWLCKPHHMEHHRKQRVAEIIRQFQFQ